jgi:uncharacterized protein (DUF1800 family)
MKTTIRTRLLSLGLAGTLSLTVFSPLAVLAEKADKTGTKKAARDERIVVHVLNRLGYGPRPGDVERVRKMGLEAYIDQQLHPERINDQALEARLQQFEMLNASTAEIMEIEERARANRKEMKQLQDRLPKGPDGKVDPSQLTPEQRKEVRERLQANGFSDKKNPRRVVTDLQQAKLVRAVYSERQLQEVMTDFWFNHFNVFAGKGLTRAFLNQYERDVIRPNAFGKFEDLLRATAQSPAMLFYLDNWQSVTPDAQPPFMGRRQGGGRARGIFGGFGQARPQAQQQPKRKIGINENYARELMELHTLGVDGGYSQKDVQEVARCFTGWSIYRPYGKALGGRAALMQADESKMGTFVFNDWAHDKGEKVVLGQKIGSGGGMDEGNRVLKMLATHPSTAKFIATKLCRRFISDNPPQEAVDAAAKTFLATGGDIRAVLKTIFTSPQFFATEAYNSKVKTPLELVASSLRATNAEVANAQVLVGVMTRMGMPIYGCQPPTGYNDTADAWVNTGALLNRLNFGLALAGNKLPGVRSPIEQNARLAGDQSNVLDNLFETYLYGEVSEQTRKTLSEALANPQMFAQIKQGPEPANGQMARDPNDVIDEDVPEGENGEQMPGPRRRQPGAKIKGLGNAGGRAYERSLEDLARSGQPLSQVAQLTGLVLGSPEFQRK